MLVTQVPQGRCYQHYLFIKTRQMEETKPKKKIVGRKTTEKLEVTDEKTQLTSKLF